MATTKKSPQTLRELTGRTIVKQGPFRGTCSSARQEPSPNKRIENASDYVEALPVPPAVQKQVGYLFMHMELEYACKKDIPYHG